MPKLPTSYIAQQDPPDKNDAYRFLQALDPSARSFLFVAIKEHAAPKVSRAPLDDNSLSSLAQFNAEEFNIYVTVNETTHGEGTGRLNEEVTRFRCVYTDDDGKSQAKPYPIPPSWVVETSPGKKQVYWFINDCSGRDEWDGVQQTLVNEYGGDPNARDAARILRVPGYYNCKSEYASPPKSRTISADLHRYSWQQILAAFPPSQVLRGTGQPLGESLDIKTTLEQFLTGANYHDSAIRLAGYYHNSGIRNREKLIEFLQSLIDVEGDPTDARFSQRRNVDIPNTVDWILKKRMEEELAPNVTSIFEEHDLNILADKYTRLPIPGGNMYLIVEWVKTLMRYPNDTIAIIVAEHLVSVFGGGSFHIHNNTTTRKRIMLAPLGSGKNTIVRAMSKIVQALQGLSTEDNMPHLLDAADFIGADSFSFSTQHKQIEQHRVRSFIVNEAGESGRSTAGDIDNLRAYQLQALSTKADEAFYPKKFSEQGRNESDKQMQTVYNAVWVYLHESTLKSYATLLQDSGSFVNGDLSRSDIFFVNPQIDEGGVRREFHDAPVPPHILNIFKALANQMRKGGINTGVQNKPAFHPIDTLEIEERLFNLEVQTVKERNQATLEEDEIRIAMLGRRHERILCTILVCALADAAVAGKMYLPVAKHHHLDYAIRRAQAIDASLMYHASKGGVLSSDPFEQATKQFIDKFKELCADTKKAQRLMKKGTRTGNHGESWIMNFTALTQMMQRGAYQTMVKTIYRGDAKRARAAFLENLEGLEIIVPVTYIGQDNKVQREKNRWWLPESMFPVKQHK